MDGNLIRGIDGRLAQARLQAGDGAGNADLGQLAGEAKCRDLVRILECSQIVEDDRGVNDLDVGQHRLQSLG